MPFFFPRKSHFPRKNSSLVGKTQNILEEEEEEEEEQQQEEETVLLTYLYLERL